MTNIVWRKSGKCYTLQLTTMSQLELNYQVCLQFHGSPVTALTKCISNTKVSTSLPILISNKNRSFDVDTTVSRTLLHNKSLLENDKEIFDSNQPTISRIYDYYTTEPWINNSKQWIRYNGGLRWRFDDFERHRLQRAQVIKLLFHASPVFGKKVLCDNQSQRKRRTINLLE